MFELRYITDVVTLELDGARCTGCGMCVEVCPHAVFVMSDGAAEIADRDACMECGACEVNCPPGAISVRPGVGCAAAVISSAVRKTDPGHACCGEEDDKTTPCCG